MRYPILDLWGILKEKCRGDDMHPKTDELQATFDQLADQWRKETEFHSFAYFITDNPSYRQIVAMGEAVLPLIFRAIETRPYLWYYALRDITGTGPVIAEEDRGIPKKIHAAWLKWGRENGYSW